MAKTVIEIIKEFEERLETMEEAFCELYNDFYDGEYYDDDDCCDCDYCNLCNVKKFHYYDPNEDWYDHVGDYDFVIEFKHDDEKCDMWDCPNCTSYLNCIERKVQ